MFPPLARTAAALALLGTLTACETILGTKEKMLCTPVSVLKDASKSVSFSGPGRDIIDLNYAAEIDWVNDSCEFEIHETTRAGTMSMRVTPVFTVERGNANTDKRARLPYFVALTTADRKILERWTQDFEAVFPGNVTRMKVTDDPVSFDLKVTREKPAGSYQIYVGFLLSRDAVEFNRQQFRRR